MKKKKNTSRNFKIRVKRKKCESSWKKKNTWVEKEITLASCVVHRCLHFTETRRLSKIVVCWLPNIADFVTQTCHARTDKHYKNYSKTLASTSSDQGNNYSRHEPNMLLTRTPRYTRTKSTFPWISPHFSVIFTRLTRTRKTRTKFPFPSSKFHWNLPR